MPNDMQPGLNKNVLLLESLTPDTEQVLHNHVQVFKALSPTSGGEVAVRQPVHAIITRGLGAVNAELIKHCHGLEIIARAGVGLDNVDVEFATAQGIKVINAPGSNADTVAEHTLALMLALQRRLYTSIEAVKDNRWDYRKSYGGDEIRGKILGILGMGNIGRRVAQLAQAFGMDIWYASQKPADVPYNLVSFKKLLVQADIISLHLPLTSQTRNLLNRASIAQLQPHTLIINTSRGEVIDQQALTEALLDKKIGGFAADVLIQEPPAVDDVLLKLDNVLVTPHSASLTGRTYHQMCLLTVQNTLSLLRSEAIDEKYIFNRQHLGGF